MFDNYTNIMGNKHHISSVVFGSGKPLLEVELNESQEHQKTMLWDSISSIAGSGVLTPELLQLESNNLYVSPKCKFLVDGVIVQIPEQALQLTWSGTKLYLVVEEVLKSHNDRVTYSGISNPNNSGVTFRSGSNTLNNTVALQLIDGRFSEETTKRKVVNYFFTSNVSLTTGKRHLLLVENTSLVCKPVGASPESITNLIQSSTLIWTSSYDFIKNQLGSDGYLGSTSYCFIYGGEANEPMLDGKTLYQHFTSSGRRLLVFPDMVHGQEGHPKFFKSPALIMCRQEGSGTIGAYILSTGGALSAEELSKVGLKVLNVTFHNDVIFPSNPVKLTDGIPFILNLEQVYMETLNISDITRFSYREADEGQTYLLSLSNFNDKPVPEFLLTDQRQFLAMKAGNKLWLDLHTAGSISKLERRVEEAFQSAREGKIKLADAITSKGQVVSNTASFQEMAQKIRGIKTGYSSGDFLNPQQFTYFRQYVEKVYIPNFSTASPYTYLGTVLDGITPYVIFTKTVGKSFIVGIKKVEYDYPTGDIPNYNELTTNDSPYDYTIELPSTTSDNYTMADIIIVGGMAFLHCGKGVQTRYFIMCELNYGRSATIRAEIPVPNTSIDSCNFFAESYCWAITRGKTITVIKFNPVSGQYSLTDHEVPPDYNRVFLATPLGFYIADDVTLPSFTGGGSGIRSKDLHFYSYDNPNKVKKTIPVLNAKSVVTYTYSSFNKSRVNIPYHCFCFVADNSSYPSSRDYIVYALDYVNHNLITVYNHPSTPTRIGDGLLLNSRYAIAYLKNNVPTVFLKGTGTHESLVEAFRYMGGESLETDVQYIHILADKDERFYFAQKKLNGKEHSYYTRGLVEGGLIR